MTTARPLHFWHCAGDIVMRPAYGRPIPLEREHYEATRALLRDHARAAYQAGDTDAACHWAVKWQDLTNAMDDLANWQRIIGRNPHTNGAA
jgi:hypothetical protein